MEVDQMLLGIHTRDAQIATEHWVKEKLQSFTQWVVHFEAFHKREGSMDL